MLGQPTQTGSGKLNLRSGVDLYFVVLGLQSKHTERKRHKNDFRNVADREFQLAERLASLSSARKHFQILSVKRTHLLLNAVDRDCTGSSFLVWQYFAQIYPDDPLV